MKQTFLILSLFSTLFSFSQNGITQNDSFKTKIEQAVNYKNALIKSEYVDLDRIKKVNFRYIKVYNYETKETLKGLYISHKSGKYKKTHYLDSVEIMSFYKNLKQVDDSLGVILKETEFIIISKDYFKVSVKIDDWTMGRQRYFYINKERKRSIKLSERKYEKLIEVFGKANQLLQKPN